jgi:amidophosphoribosyltransferase
VGELIRQELLKGKVIIVTTHHRGTTVKTRVKALRAPERQTGTCIPALPHRFPCHYGIDFPRGAS